MRSILAVLAAVAVALPVTTAQMCGSPTSCGVGGGKDRSIVVLAPRGHEVSVAVPSEVCAPNIIIGITATACTSDVLPPRVECPLDVGSVIVTRLGDPNAIVQINFLVTCSSDKSLLGQNSTYKKLAPTAKKLS